MEAATEEVEITPQRGILAIKQAVFERDGGRCAKCGMTQEGHIAEYDRALEIHRKEPGSLYSLEGCVTLCKKCHGPEPKSQPGAIDRARGRRTKAADRTHPVGLQFFTTPPVARRFKEYLASLPSDRRPTRRAVLEVALIQYLASKGFPVE